VFSGDNKAVVYYLPGAKGWGTPFGGLTPVMWTLLTASNAIAATKPTSP
jgi:hypothetical protein